MKRLYTLAALLFLSVALLAQQPQTFADLPIYTGTDLGVTYTSDSTTFKLWSPAAKAVSVALYFAEEDVILHLNIALRFNPTTGVWAGSDDAAVHPGMEYLFEIEMPDGTVHNTPGIYARAVGANGTPGFIVDLDATDPPGWENDTRPPLESFSDIILYEMHVRDMTSDVSSGSSLPAKFLGLVENGTLSPDGLTTGIDHLKELGITHVHLLPSFDFKSVNELQDLTNQYNWGYDPVNYNVPEGSYASGTANPTTRIREFKKMVQGFHQNGIRVVMDVVYNHTAESDQSNFSLEYPGYYYRHDANGNWSNASGCGNETASERYMMRKYMIESVKYWATEYHIDGFRFDLMGIHDIETMNLIAEELHKIDPSIFIYGEGWTAGDSPLPEEERALKKNAKQLNGVAFFSDDIRDGIKGSVFEESSRGFVGGDKGHEMDVMFGLVGGVAHSQVDMSRVHYSDEAWSPSPMQTISYVSCHDNHTLYDKLVLANPDATPEEIVKMHKLSLAIVLLAQGVPFLHAGSEMMRTKGGEHNSYNLPDSINRIDWTWKSEHYDVFNYTRKLIALRKETPAFRLQTAQEVREKLRFLDTEPGVIAYEINHDGATYRVIINANREKIASTLIVPQDLPESKKQEWLKEALLFGEVETSALLPLSVVVLKID